MKKVMRGIIYDTNCNGSGSKGIGRMKGEKV